MPHRSARFVTIAAFSTLLAPHAAATGYGDAAKGFAIAQPPPFVVVPITHRALDVAVGVRSTTGNPRAMGQNADGSLPFLCQAGFKAAAQNAGLSKDDINAFVATREWRNLASATLELGFVIDWESTFSFAGFNGLELEGRPKAAPGAKDVRAVISFIETARGRTSMICIKNRRSFASAIRDFRKIRATITVPE